MGHERGLVIAIVMIVISHGVAVQFPLRSPDRSSELTPGTLVNVTWDLLPGTVSTLSPLFISSLTYTHTHLLTLPIEPWYHRAAKQCR